MHPILFQYGSFAIYSLWFFIALSLISSLMLLNHMGQRSRTRIKVVFNHLPSLFLFGFIGSRLLYVAFNWQMYFFEFTFSELIYITHIWDRGFSAWGMVIGLTIRLFMLARRYQEDFISWIDTLSVVYIASTILGNIGAFFEGLNYGNETNLPWGITFESGMIKYAVPIHPTQLYSATVSLILTFILYRLWKSKFGNIPGNITLVSTLSYCTWIFLQGFVRGDDTIIFGPLRIEQWLSLIAILIAGGIWFSRKEKKTVPTPLKTKTKKETTQKPPKPKKSPASKTKP